MVFDENLFWKNDIKEAENKLAKNVVLLYCVKQFLDKPLKTMKVWKFCGKAQFRVIRIRISILLDIRFEL